MSAYDIYEFLKANPNKAFANTDLAAIFQINVETICQNTKKLRESKLINYDLQKIAPNGKRYRMLFYVNAARQPVVDTLKGFEQRTADFKQHSPHLINRQKILSRQFRENDTDETKRQLVHNDYRLSDLVQ